TNPRSRLWNGFRQNAQNLTLHSPVKEELSYPPDNDKNQQSTIMATSHSQQIVQKLWNYCNVLRDDGLSYGDYVEQLTYLLFLKMAHEQTQPPWNRANPIP